MANVNKVILIGNLTRDPEVKYTPKGSAVTDLGLAINRSYSLDNGEKREETTFVDVELWGRLAEIAGEYARKGQPLFVEGRLRMDTWEDKNSGQKRSRIKVVGENIQLLGSRPSGAGQHSSGGGGGYEERPERYDRPERQERSDRPPSRPPARSSAPPSSHSAAPASHDEDDDVPF